MLTESIIAADTDIFPSTLHGLLYFITKGAFASLLDGVADD